MIPGDHLATRGSAPAIIMAESGECVTYQQLEDRANRLARLFWASGLRPGDTVALLLENHPRYLEVFWATQRSGLYLMPINWHVRSSEVAYILADSQASALIASTALRDTVALLVDNAPMARIKLAIDGDIEGFQSYERALEEHPPEPLEQQVEGSLMIYSSGTTGRPKGIRRQLVARPYGQVDPFIVPVLRNRWGADADTVYLSPAPLYHMAPLGWTSAIHRIGGAVVVMERFDPSAALEAIELHGVTLAQFVPTHFIRMLKLPAEQRRRFSYRSLRAAIHAAAPCPPAVKDRMLEWWGPIIHEYYGASEGIGMCVIGPEEWITHRGSVGRAVVGKVHVLDDDGLELAPNEVGEVWFEGAPRFEYHHDSERTEKAFNDRGWASVGDIGRMDEEGYLYLTDRSVELVITGGVNVYPRESEDILAVHPAVADVAVIGVPDDEMGERLLAIVELDPHQVASSDLGAELLAYCRERLATFKCPTSVDFVQALPRLPNGKLLKRELRERYRQNA